MSDLGLWAYERGTLWAREGERVDNVRVLPTLSAAFGEVQSAAADELAAAMGLASAAPVVERFERGKRCFAAWVDGSIASYGWVSQGDEYIGELERLFHMLPDEAYIWDCSTLPRYRGHRLYCALLSHIAATLFNSGVQRLWIGASVTNTYSIRGFAAAGFQPVLDLTYLRLLGIRHTWIEAANPATPPALAARASNAMGVYLKRSAGG